MKEEFKSTTQTLEELKGHNEKLEEDQKRSLENIKELEMRVKDSNNKTGELEIECENYRTQIVSKEKESESLKKELESMRNEFEMEISEKEKKFESMKTEFDARNSEKENELESMKRELTEISDIKDEYEKKIKENEGKISELQERNQTLETQMLQAINMPKLLKQVRDILVSKGFISEMEFEDIMKQK